ncbi:MAG: hypothetical protein HC880_08625 [Bacteroidia bacterium]|nr:hypothetical protein [Bacteroidia bacterium]
MMKSCKKRKGWTHISAAIALQEVENQQNPELIPLKQQAEKLRNSLSQDVRELYQFTHSTEGIPISNLLDEWLSNIINAEVTSARAHALAQRLQEIDTLYNEFAPLGSGLKKLEREVDLHERAYIQILHDLNLALLRQQNVEMSSSVEVMDEPDLKSLGRKRMMLVVLAFLVGAIFIISLIVGIELLDTTLKTPDRALRSTRLEFLSAYPLIRRKYEKMNAYIAPLLVTRSLSRLEIALAQSNAAKPASMAWASVLGREGTTTLCRQLVERLRDNGHKVLYFYPGEEDTDQTDELCYPDSDQFLFAKIGKNWRPAGYQTPKRMITSFWSSSLVQRPFSIVSAQAMRPGGAGAPGKPLLAGCRPGYRPAF